ncbi:MAG: SDR family oxidoreductase [Marinicaulis sp.]|nr:SDR family oxidoreductase [Marinicaulis sp.]NNE42302.1 SDR family oxidoreductase [Marinicaulis sp.]NNL89601.1 SDR family oxidoreductase [Marinicaulis sp.]
MKRLNGRSAIVTGAARGIGRGIVERFLAEGASVLMVDILSDELEKTARELGASDSNLQSLAVDLTAVDAPTKIRETAEKAFGRIDILVNNAGIGITGKIGDFTDAQWDKVLGVNVTAPFRIAREIVPKMADQGFGRVVNITSFAATAGQREDTAYAVSKAGLEALTRSIAVDYGRAGITCNAIAPGVIVTPLSEAVLGDLDPRLPIVQVVIGNRPAPFNGAPSDIAAAAAFLASDDARYVTGHVIPVDGGAGTVRYVPDPDGVSMKRFVEEDLRSIGSRG